MLKEKARILVVDDNLGVIDFYKALLESEGYSVDYAKTGKEGFKKVRLHRYDLVHLDINMPDWNGFDFLAGIEALGIETSVLVISGNLGEEVQKSLDMQKSVIGYMKKPANTEKYLKTVSDVVEGTVKDLGFIV